MVSTNRNRPFQVGQRVRIQTTHLDEMNGIEGVIVQRTYFRDEVTYVITIGNTLGESINLPVHFNLLEAVSEY